MPTALKNMKLALGNNKKNAKFIKTKLQFQQYITK